MLYGWFIVQKYHYHSRGQYLRATDKLLKLLYLCRELCRYTHFDYYDKLLHFTLPVSVVIIVQRVCHKGVFRIVERTKD